MVLCTLLRLLQPSASVVYLSVQRSNRSQQRERRMYAFSNWLGHRDSFGSIPSAGRPRRSSAPSVPSSSKAFSEGPPGSFLKLAQSSLLRRVRFNGNEFNRSSCTHFVLRHDPAATVINLRVLCDRSSLQPWDAAGFMRCCFGGALGHDNPRRQRVESSC